MPPSANSKSARRSMVTCGNDQGKKPARDEPGERDPRDPKDAGSASTGKSPPGGLERRRPRAEPLPAAAVDAKRRLDDITRLVSDWVWEADADIRLTYASHRIVELLGQQPVELVGKRLTDFGTFVTSDGHALAPQWRSPFRDMPFETKDRDGQPTTKLTGTNTRRKEK